MGSLEAIHVAPQTGDERASRIGGPADLAGGRVAEGVERHVRRAARGGRDPDVEEAAVGVVADVVNAVAAGAAAGALGCEEELAAGDRSAGGSPSTTAQSGPCGEEIEAG